MILAGHSKTLYVIRGLPGGGKSSFFRELAVYVGMGASFGYAVQFVVAEGVLAPNPGRCATWRQSIHGVPDKVIQRMAERWEHVSPIFAIAVKERDGQRSPKGNRGEK